MNFIKPGPGFTFSAPLSPREIRNHAQLSNGALESETKTDWEQWKMGDGRVMFLAPAARPILEKFANITRTINP